MEAKVKGRIWVELEGEKFMGKGHLQLLNAIQETGSLNGAAKQTGISYRKAWRLIHQINELAKEEVVLLKKGGAKGGGTKITAYGLQLLEFYSGLQREFSEKMQSYIQKHEELWK
ncbi:winged helix-turn-helix domain-containing protein [Algoriphagus sediminis]|uniref:LysR family transcriptional regulator n=1 Tax=Algoriphagus sediminis TaxID=3057113 RepID=A0ABT7YFF0_9BACT|nr:LysR family transcriptional regulator [Algoriphagus sediminis]MDN3205249.1 LysR family transcriptional regulator [Algoriphagus sediminis]